MEGFEFFPGGFSMTYFTENDAKTRVVLYDDLVSIRFQHFANDTYRLVFEMRGVVEAAIALTDKAKLVAQHKEILADFLAYKRTSKQGHLERLAQAHETLGERVGRCLEALEFVPGIPGNESEAAVERCKKRARGGEPEE